MSRRKRIAVILSGIAVFVVLVFGVGILKVKDYTDRCPHIYPKEYVMAEVGSTLTLEELADVKVLKGNHSFEAWIESDIETQITDAKVSDDRQSIYVGTDIGNITATIDARGLDDAAAKQVEIRVYVN